MILVILNDTETILKFTKDVNLRWISLGLANESLNHGSHGALTNKNCDFVGDAIVFTLWLCQNS